MTSFPTWPEFDDETRDRVARVLSNGQVNYWTGSEGRLFEKEFAQLCEVPHAIAVSNGTVALELCLQALNIGAANGGTILDEVITTPRSFVATASAIVRAGARVVFADVDPISQNITPRSVKPRITERTKAIIAVHLAGWPCDMIGFKKLTETRDIALIEDCAQAHGARLGDTSVGGLGDLAAWSFCQDKIMTTGGEGGAITCHSDTLANRIWSLKDHGKSREKLSSADANAAFKYVHDTIGTNARMTEISATIGRQQIGYLPSWTKIRSRHSAVLESALAEFAGPDGSIRLTPFSDKIGSHARYKYYAFLRPENLQYPFQRNEILAQLRAAGVPAQTGICPEIYREAAFARHYQGPRLPIAKLLGETSIMFQVHPSLSDEHIDIMCKSIRDILGRATKRRIYRSA